MVATHISTPELIRLDAIRELLRTPGPCLTFFLPPYRPGEASPSPAAFLKSKIREAARGLAERGVVNSAARDLLEPLEQLTEDATLARGSRWGRLILRSPGLFEQFFLVHPVTGGFTVGGTFAIRKVAQEFTRPEKFYVLALFKNRVKLLACTGLTVEEAKLPPQVPATLADALQFEAPDHDLENRAPVGSSPAGVIRNVRFGTGSGHEREQNHLADYYKIVDRGLHEFVLEPNTPLILAGVSEDVALYSSAATYRKPVKGEIAGSLDFSQTGYDELLGQGYRILREAETEREMAAVHASLERRTPARFSTHLDKILHAAFEGRIGDLYVSREAVRVDVYERGKYYSWGAEDLINLAMTRTLLNRGKTFEVPAEALPEGAVAAAIMRF